MLASARRTFAIPPPEVASPSGRPWELVCVSNLAKSCVSGALAPRPRSSDSIGHFVQSFGSNNKQNIVCLALGGQEGSHNGAMLNGKHVDFAPPSLHLPVSGRASDRLDVVGVLGGMSPTWTADFMMKVVQSTPAQNDWDHIPMVVCSVPQLPDLNKAINEDPEGIALGPLLEKRRFLEQAGAKCIVMPSHLAHHWYDELANGCSVPFLHIADAVAQELDRAEMEPLEAGGRIKVGLLGSEEVLKANIYQDRLQARGYEVVIPDHPTMEHALLPGLEALERGDQEGARNLLGIAVQVLLVNAVNVVILACGQVSSVFPPNDPLLLRCLSPTAALARYTVRWAQGVRARTGPIMRQ